MKRTGVELKARTEVDVRGKLKPGFKQSVRILGSWKNTAEKLASRFCMAHALTVPKEGKTAVHMANFSEQPMLVRPGQTVVQFYLFDHTDLMLQ